MTDAVVEERGAGGRRGEQINCLSQVSAKSALWSVF
jgi:hypothetical protein